jgi:D-alanyl-D-alanine carboxypeptidase/D-alanyl-D-alanine-endopeptidase (penicillin-binding protein 4)
MKKVVLLLVLALALPVHAKRISPQKTRVKPGRAPACVAPTAKKATAGPRRRPMARRAGKSVAKLAAKPGRKPGARSVAKPASKPATRLAAKPTGKPQARPSSKPVGKPAARPLAQAGPRPAARPSAPPGNEVAKPSASDPERERIETLQEELEAVVRGKVLGRLRVGMRVENLANGRVLFGWRSHVPMDPASNQKVLATTAALLRLGNRFRYRTEVTGPRPDGSGTIEGDVILRGSGDPSLRSRHIDAMAADLATAGVTRVTGSVLGDPRRIGSDESVPSARAPLRVGGSAIEIRVRPGEKVGGRPQVSIRPASDAFVLVNEAKTRQRGRTRLSVAILRAGGRFQVKVGGKISKARGEAVLFRAPPSPPLYAAVLLRHALAQAGIVVQGPAGINSGEARSRVARDRMWDGHLFALGQQGSDVAPPLQEGGQSQAEILALHESDTLPVLLRRVNKNSDNEWAERVLETVGAEVLGGAPTTGKGVRVLRDSLAEFGLPASEFSPANGSGLGHQNRVTAAGMTTLLRRLYFDPRVGPEIMQSLSVGGVDGTTRNRFRGTASAHRVRAKTGTLSGVSCLSGFVGDGRDILAFSILVEGHRKRAVSAVRAAQVGAVNAMMRFAQHGVGVPPADEGTPGTDYETGEEADDDQGPAAESP